MRDLMDDDDFQAFRQMCISKEENGDDHDNHSANLSDIVDTTIEQEQVTIRRNSWNLRAAAFTSTEQELKCDLQLIEDSFDLDDGKWTHMTKDGSGGVTTTGAVKLKETAIFLICVFETERARRTVCIGYEGQVYVEYEHSDGHCVPVLTHNDSLELSMMMHRFCFSSELRTTPHPCLV